MYPDHGRISRLTPFRRDPMHADVLRAINVQINSEFSAWYQYLAMAAFCEREMFTGAAKWLKAQSAEEYQHGMKLFDFVHARNGVVELLRDRAADARVRVVRRGVRGRAQAGRVGHGADQRAVRAGVQVQGVRRNDRAPVVSDRAGRGREDRRASIVAKFRLVGDDPGSLLDLDRELGARVRPQ